MLAGCGAEGCTKGILRANGLSISDMAELVQAKLATAPAERVAHFRITPAGKRALSKAERAK